METLHAFPAALPEIFLLAAACTVLILDQFVGQIRNLTYGITLTVLVVLGVLCIDDLNAGRVAYVFGGMFLSDPMTAVLKIAAIVASALSLVYAQSYARDRDMWRGEFFSLVLFTLLGIMLMISANNLIVIYLGLELQALALYGLVALRRDDVRASEAAMKYFVLGALASGFLLYGMSLVYGATGTLDINELSRRIGSGQAMHLPLVLGAIFIVSGIAFKLGAAPFHMWVPDVYQGAPTPVVLLLSSAPKLAAFAITFRILVEGMPQLAVDWQRMIGLVALLSIAVGNVTAVAQTNLKRMLGYSTVAQMGFMLLALLAGVVGGNLSITAGAYSAAMFYVVTYSVSSAGCFGVILLMSRQGFEAEHIADYAGLAKRNPMAAAVMSLMMLSLAGLPPLVGFFAKFSVLQALVSDGASAHMFKIAVAAVLFSLIGAFYYLRVVKTMWFDEPTDPTAVAAPTDTQWTLAINGALVLALGILPQGLINLCNSAVVRALGG
jgi:NADH-quinone oxidoreductase subunit N